MQDAQLVALKRGLEGSVVSSKLYGTLVAGRPVAAAAAKNSEIALVVAEHDFGIRIQADNPAAPAAPTDAVLRIPKADSEALDRRGRHAFERRHYRPEATSTYENGLAAAVQESRAG